MPEQRQIDENQERIERGGKTMKFTFQPESKPLDGYTIKRAIHRGGFGEVYYALSDAGKEVALKLLKQHLDVEIRGVSQCLNLKHPNLVTIFDIRTDNDGDHWVVMEYITGKSLNQVLEQHPHGMPLVDVEKWLAGMVDGLAFLHDRGIVHRDLKPANVFIENGVVKIGDVGLSKFISESHRSAQTQSVGTVYYMAPEVAHGRYGREVDTYSLGIMLYELLTGRVPFTGESAGEILMKHLSERPDLSPIPMRLRSVIAYALEKDPLRRTPSAARMLEDFRKAVRGFDIPRDIPNESFVAHTVADSSAPRRDDRIPPAPPHNLKDQIAKDAREFAKFAKEGARHAQDWARNVQHAAKNGQFRKWYDSRAKGHHAQHAEGADDPHAAYPHGKRQFWIVIGVVLILLVMSDTLREIVFEGIVPLAFVGAIIYGVYWFMKGTFSAAPAAPHVTPMPGTPPPQGAYAPPAAPYAGNPPMQAAVKIAVAPPQPPRPKKAVLLTPNALRPMSWRQRMSDLSSSLALASLCTVVITLVLLNFTTLFKNSAQIGFFAGTTLIASWCVLAVSKLMEGRRIDGFIRRMVFLAVGLAVGSAAFTLDRSLLLEEYSRGSFRTHGPNQITDPMFSSFGTIELQKRFVDGQGTEPTYAGYLVFFGALFAIRRWWWHADSFRWRRFRPMSVATTALTAIVVMTVWVFPQIWGLTWAAAISSIVQLSASWVAPPERSGVPEALKNE